MPQSACAIFGCTNGTRKLLEVKKEICPTHSKRRGLCKCLPFQHFKFPKDDSLRQQWVKLVNRQKGNSDSSLWVPNKDSVVCSEHFVDSRPTLSNPSPTLNLGYQTHIKPNKIRERRSLSVPEKSAEVETMELEEREHVTGSIECDTPNELLIGVDVLNIRAEENDANEYASSTEEDWTTASQKAPINLRKQPDNREIEIKQLKEKLATKTQVIRNLRRELEGLKKPVHQKLLVDDSACRFYTNIPTVAVFMLICNYVKAQMSYNEKLASQRSKHTLFAKRHRFFKSKRIYKKFQKLSHIDGILMTLMKLRLGLLHTDLAQRFGISVKDVSNTFHFYVSNIAKALKPVLLLFHPRSTVAKTLPKEYHHYKRLRCIIDCSEIFIEKPQDLQLQAATWSDYKHHNTLKFLIAITPQGSICFISKLWGGRSSDRHIVVSSGFLSYLHPQDQVLADRGFTVREELMMKGAELVMPPAAKGKSQMTSSDVAKTKKVANVRIHVERVIRKLKTFHILSHIVRLATLRTGSFDDVITVCCAIINLHSPIVKHWNETV